MNTEEIASRRRTRRKPATLVNNTRLALAHSRRLLARGDIADAARAAQLAERHAKLAERLLDLDAAVNRIHQAKHQVERAIIEREVRLTEREAALAARERAAAPPADDYSWFDVRDPRFHELMQRMATKRAAEGS